MVTFPMADNGSGRRARRILFPVDFLYKSIESREQRRMQKKSMQTNRLLPFLTIALVSLSYSFAKVVGKWRWL